MNKKTEDVIVSFTPHNVQISHTSDFIVNIEPLKKYKLYIMITLWNQSTQLVCCTYDQAFEISFKNIGSKTNPVFTSIIIEDYEDSKVYDLLPPKWIISSNCQDNQIKINSSLQLSKTDLTTRIDNISGQVLFKMNPIK